MGGFLPMVPSHSSAEDVLICRPPLLVPKTSFRTCRPVNIAGGSRLRQFRCAARAAVDVDIALLSIWFSIALSRHTRYQGIINNPALIIVPSRPSLRLNTAEMLLIGREIRFGDIVCQHHLRLRHACA